MGCVKNNFAQDTMEKKAVDVKAQFLLIVKKINFFKICCISIFYGVFKKFLSIVSYLNI